MDNNCRWQAMIVVGEYIAERPEDVWRLVERYGCDEDADMRAATATVLLEHLLLPKRPRYRRKAETLARQDAKFAETLSLCWDFDD